MTPTEDLLGCLPFSYPDHVPLYNIKKNAFLALFLLSKLPSNKGFVKRLQDFFTSRRLLCSYHTISYIRASTMKIKVFSSRNGSAAESHKPDKKVL